jgi:hypothetical protein
LRHAARVESPVAVARRTTDPAALKSRAFSRATPTNADTSRHPARGCHRLSAIQRQRPRTFPPGTRSPLLPRPKAHAETMPETGTERPGTIQDRPSAPRHHTHQPRDSLRPLRKNARASSPNTRTGPPRQTSARTLETPRALNPRRSRPARHRPPQRSRAEPSPERHPRTPTLYATRPEVATASAPSNAQGPARSHPAHPRTSSPVPRPTPEPCQRQARNTPAHFKPRPQRLGITRANPGTISGPSEKMRAHPLRTPEREHPSKPAPERLRHAARVESPAQSPGAPQTPQPSGAAPSPKRNPRTPTLHATRTEVATASAPSSAQRPRTFPPGTRSRIFTPPKARPGTLTDTGTEHPGTLQAPPSAPRHHTHQLRDSLRPLRKNARPHPLRTPEREHPGKPAPERLRRPAR